MTTHRHEIVYAAQYFVLASNPTPMDTTATILNPV